ncbi:MAG TPA: DUF4419 domain-containing protein [Candidatus Limnocylindrales bacterium]
MRQFAVDDVTPAAEPLPTVALGELFEDALAVGGDPALRVLAPDGVHPLLSAVGRAFADHRPLVLSPDAVWLTITQGVAQHIRLHAGQLRPLLVNHEGRKRLTVQVQAVPRDADSWRDAVDVFHKQLAAEISDPGLFDCDFTTSTETERVAGRVVMLDAYSPYFSLWMVAVCGIPSVTLMGTPQDWRKIRQRIDSLVPFGLEKWCRSLAPIADQFVRAASGDVDTAFWQRIYNPVDAYGGEVITGWIARLYPYLKEEGAPSRPNPLLDLEVGEPRNVTVEGRRWYDGPSIRSTGVPATLSRVTINLNDRITRENRKVAVHAGLVAVAQDTDGALCPVAGWFVAPETVRIDAVIDRIVKEHKADPPQADRHLHGPAELLALHHRVGSATLFDGAWRLLPNAEQHSVGFGRLWGYTAFELADGRSICYVTIDYREDTAYWVVCRVEPEPSGPHGIRSRNSDLLDDPAEVPVLGTSLALILEAALDSGGDIAHLETGRLDQLYASTRRSRS